MIDLSCQNLENIFYLKHISGNKKEKKRKKQRKKKEMSSFKNWRAAYGQGNPLGNGGYC